MTHRWFGLGLVTLLLGVVSLSASGVEIFGRLEYTSAGSFVIDESTGEVVGFDFYGDTPDGDGIGEVGEQVGEIGLVSGEIARLLALPDGELLLPDGPKMEIFDFDLRSSSPIYEWIVKAEGYGVPEHRLTFRITGGGEVDDGDSALDLAGSGVLSLVCVDTPELCADYDSGYEDTISTWSLSNATGFLVTGTTVPEPVTLGLLGVGLIILGVSRRRVRVPA